MWAFFWWLKLKEYSILDTTILTDLKTPDLTSEKRRSNDEKRSNTQVNSHKNYRKNSKITVRNLTVLT